VRILVNNNQQESKIACSSTTEYAGQQVALNMGVNLGVAAVVCRKR
jgi:hypothetical protein